MKSNNEQDVIDTTLHTLYVGARVGDVVEFRLAGELCSGIVIMRRFEQYRVHVRDGVRVQLRPCDIVRNLTEDALAYLHNQSE